MECLKDHVNKKYHRLLLNGLPNFQILLGHKTSTESNLKNQVSSAKILNGPEMSRESNESETDMVKSVIGLDFGNNAINSVFFCALFYIGLHARNEYDWL